MVLPLENASRIRANTPTSDSYAYAPHDESLNTFWCGHSTRGKEGMGDHHKQHHLGHQPGKFTTESIAAFGLHQLAAPPGSKPSFQVRLMAGVR